MPEKDKALKNDARDGKVGRHYIHPTTLRGLGAAHYAGELKYGAFNFTKGHKASQLIGAILDHAAQWSWGEDLDKDCTDRIGISVSHLDCILSNVNMLKTQLAEGTLIDDRYTKETIDANLSLAKQGNE
jgi:hypothetical protein